MVLLLLISNIIALWTENVIYMLSVLWHLIESCCDLEHGHCKYSTCA